MRVLFGPTSPLPGEAPSAEVDALLADLTPNQHRAVVSPSSPLVVLAGAGTGKTRVLTRRIAHQLATGRAAPEHVLALTFTRKAAAELGSRLQSMGVRDRVTAGTFHAVASAQLRRWWADQGRHALTLLSSPSRLIKALVAETPSLQATPISELVAELTWAQARLIRPEHFPAAVASSGRQLPVEAEILGGLYGRYEDEKRRRGLVDFDDLLARCADAIDTDHQFAAAQRWRWRHVFVDEFQDVNPLQHRLLLAWLGSDAELTVVGDPNQAIYGWNGADPGLLDSVPGHWPSAEVVRLDDNHRCTPQIVAAGVAVLGPSSRSLRSSRPDGPAPTVRAFVSDGAEAEAVALELQDAHAGGLPWSQMAVLVRTNAQGLPLRRAFEAAGIPCVASSQADVLRHPAAIEALEELRPRAALPVAVAVADLGVASREAAYPDVSGPASDGLMSNDGVAGGGVAGGEAAATVEAATVEAATVLHLLAELARDLRRLDHRATIGSFLAWLPSAAGREAGSIGEPDAVTITSFHRAKGLEWRAVWVCGLEAGLVPSGRALTPAAQAEERRLLYVALTRAETDLHCSWAARRAFGDRTTARTPSPWLSLIGETSQTPPPEQNTTDWRAILAEQRRRLRHGDPAVGGTLAPSGTLGTPGPSGIPDETGPHRSGQLGLDLDGGADTPSPRPFGDAAGPDAGGTGSAPDDLDGQQVQRRLRRDRTAVSTRDAEILERLVAWRQDRARGVGIPAEMVLANRSVEALAVVRPRVAAELTAIPGLGPVRAARFGATLLELVAGTAAVA